MRTADVGRSLVLFALFLSPALSSIRPSFSVDYSSWHATHIVLVTTDASEDNFHVIASWKGDLGVGNRVAVPELRPNPDAIPISMYPDLQPLAIRGGISEQIPRQPVGSHIVLFLVCSTDEQSPISNPRYGRPCRWKPSEFTGSMKASVVWIDEDHLFGFTQPMNPGPSVLGVLPGSETTLFDRVSEVKEIQKDLAIALSKNGKDRAEGLRSLVHSNVLPARQSALEQLAKSGPSATPVIREMLDDAAFSDCASDLIAALVQTGGTSVGEELNNRLVRDVAFWANKGPSLPRRWWDDDIRPHAPLRERYSQTFQLVMGLQQIRFPDSLGTAIRLRDVWRSLPQLDDPRGLHQMVEECDKLIDQLQAK